MERSQVRSKAKELKKQTDDWSNNQFTDFKFQSLRNNPVEFQNFRRDKGKDIDAGKRLLGRNKRRRRRDVSEHPRNC
jgi:hypothetical protein